MRQDQMREPVDALKITDLPEMLKDNPFGVANSWSIIQRAIANTTRARMEDVLGKDNVSKQVGDGRDDTLTIVFTVGEHRYSLVVAEAPWLEADSGLEPTPEWDWETYEGVWSGELGPDGTPRERRCDPDAGDFDINTYK